MGYLLFATGFKHTSIIAYVQATSPRLCLKPRSYHHHLNQPAPFIVTSTPHNKTANILLNCRQLNNGHHVSSQQRLAISNYKIQES